MYQTVSKERGFQSFMNEPFGRRQNQRSHRLTFTDRLRRHPIPDWEPILWGGLTWISLKANKFQDLWGAKTGSSLGDSNSGQLSALPTSSPFELLNRFLTFHNSSWYACFIHRFKKAWAAKDLCLGSSTHFALQCNTWGRLFGTRFTGWSNRLGTECLVLTPDVKPRFRMYIYRKFRSSSDESRSEQTLLSQMHADPLISPLPRHLRVQPHSP